MTGLFVIFTAITLVAGSGEPRGRAEKLFHAYLSSQDQLSVDERIRRLTEILHADKRFAPAHAQLARVLVEAGTIVSRREAAEHIFRAIRIEPQNAEYQLIAGEVAQAQGLDPAPYFKRAAKLQPDFGEAHYRLALLAEERMLKYRHMIRPYESATISFSTFADEDFAQAEQELALAIQYLPNPAQAYYRLGLLYFEQNRLLDMLHLLQRATALDPANSDYWLFAGLARYYLGELREANACFSHAMQIMPPQWRANFDSLGTIVSPEENRHWLALRADERQKFKDRFWREHDPLYLTPANERLLEHFSRVAYCNLRFSRPEKQISGFATDRGKILIRYGQPLQTIRTPAELKEKADGRMDLQPAREIWQYEDFDFVFEDRFLSGNFAFAWGSVAGGTDYLDLYRQRIKTAPERFVARSPQTPMPLQIFTARFRGEADDNALEIYLGIPYPPEENQSDPLRLKLTRGFFAFDSAFVERVRTVETRNIRGAPPAPGRDFVMDRWTLAVPPGKFYTSLELVDSTFNRVAVIRDTLEMLDFRKPGLQMSDVVLARYLGPGEDAKNPYLRNGLVIIPAIQPTFAADSAIGIYYEIYNLHVREGGTKYHVETVLAPVLASETLFGRLWRRLSFWRDEQQTVTTRFDYAGTTAAEHLYNTIRLQEVKPGKWALQIRVTDDWSGETVVNSARFLLLKNQ